MTTAKKSATKKAAGKRKVHDAQHNQAMKQTEHQAIEQAGQAGHAQGGQTGSADHDHIVDVYVGGAAEGKPAKAKKISTDDRLEGLIAFLKKHGLHFDGAAIEE